MEASLIEPSRWGMDHWSTFCYLGHAFHKSGGEPDRNKMRCKPGSPRMGYFIAMLSESHDTTVCKYPTRLNDGTAIPFHDDYDCADDVIAAGLLTNTGTGMHPSYTLTPAGLTVWSYICRTRPTSWSMKSLTVDEIARETGVTLPVQV